MIQYQHTNAACLSSHYLYEWSALPEWVRKAIALSFCNCFLKKTLFFCCLQGNDQVNMHFFNLVNSNIKKNSVHWKKECQMPSTAECFTTHNSPLRINARYLKEILAVSFNAKGCINFPVWHSESSSGWKSTRHCTQVRGWRALGIVWKWVHNTSFPASSQTCREGWLQQS